MKIMDSIQVNRTIEYQEFPKYKSHKKYYIPHPSGLVSFWDNVQRSAGPYTTTGMLIERYYIYFN